MTYIVIYVRQWYGVCDADASLVLLLEHDVWGLFVDSNAKTFELGFDDSLIGKGLVHIQNDEDQMACFSDSNDLTTATFPILRTLDDTGEIEHLDLGAVILDLAGYSSQGCEFVGGDFRMLPGQLAHKRTFANGRKSDEAHAGNTCTSNIEASCWGSDTILRSMDFYDD